MENQPTPIYGYRQLSPNEIQLINQIKTLGMQMDKLIEEVRTHDPDLRALAVARTELQTGFMWLTRAVAKPEGF